MAYLDFVVFLPGRVPARVRHAYMALLVRKRHVQRCNLPLGRGVGETDRLRARDKEREREREK